MMYNVNETSVFKINIKEEFLMKKLFVFLLAMVIMCFFTCNTAATEAVVEMTRYDTASLKDFSDIVNDKTIEEHGLLERRKEDEEKSLNTLAYLIKQYRMLIIL